MLTPSLAAEANLLAPVAKLLQPCKEATHKPCGAHAQTQEGIPAGTHAPVGKTQPGPQKQLRSNPRDRPSHQAAGVMKPVLLSESKVIST